MQTELQETVLQGHTKTVHTIAVSNDMNFIVSGSEDKTIRV